MSLFWMMRRSQPDHDGHAFAFRIRQGILGDAPPFQDAKVWCHDNFGKGAVDTTVTMMGSRWAAGERTIWFRDEADAFQFKMRWC